MNFKLINLPARNAEVICAREENDKGDEFVTIRAWVSNGAGEEFLVEVMAVDSSFQAKITVAGFNGKKAEQWLKAQWNED